MGRIAIEVNQKLLRALLQAPGNFPNEQRRWEHCASLYNAQKGANLKELSAAVVRLRAIEWGFKAATTQVEPSPKTAPAIETIAAKVVDRMSRMQGFIYIPAGEAPVRLKSDKDTDLREWIHGVLTHEREKGRRLSEEALAYWATHIGGLVSLQEISIDKLRELRERIRIHMIDLGWEVSQ